MVKRRKISVGVVDFDKLPKFVEKKAEPRLIPVHWRCRHCRHINEGMFERPALRAWSGPLTCALCGRTEEYVIYV